MTFNFLLFCVLTNIVADVLCNSNHPRQLEKIGGDEVFRREVEDMYQNREDATKPPKYRSGTLDSLGGGNLLRMIQPAMSKSTSSDNLNNIENYRTDYLDIIDKLSGGELSRSLDNVETADFLTALEDTMRAENSLHKRGMDSLMGETFGESKRYIPRRTLAKRNFDEIDNVGFNNLSKKSYLFKQLKRASPRMHSLALARRGFGNPRYYASSLAKRNFDEIDRTGFEGFLKRSDK